MRPNLNKYITSQESKEQAKTFIPDENTKEDNKEKGATNVAPNLFVDSHKKGSKTSVLDALRSSNVQGVTDTGETKFMNTEEYRKYTQKEDKGISPFAFSSNYELSRALNQSNWEQTGHVAAKIIPNTILEFTSMLGNTLDFEDYINTDDEIGNWLSTWAQDKKLGNGDSFMGVDTSVYRENPGKAMDVGDYAWWMENGSALVESAAAFVGLGYLTGGAALGVLNKGAKSLKWLQTLGKTTAVGDNTRKAIQGAAGLTNTLMLNQAEGIGIAVNIYDKSYTKTFEELKASNPELDEETIEQMSRDKASKDASQGLNFNRGNMLLNMTSSFAFLKTPALARQIRNSPSLRKTLTRTVGEGFQESGEELVNLASENYGNDGDDAKFETAFRDTFTMEGLEAGFLGFIGGAAQTSLTSAGKELKVKKRPDGSRYSANDLQRERALEQEEAKQRWDKLSKEEKLTSTSDLFMTAKQLTELKNEIDKVDIQIAQARENKDTEAVGKLQLKAQELAKNTFNSKAYHAFSTGTTEQLEGFYKGVAGLTEEEAEARDLDPKTYKEKATYALERLGSLEKEFNKANNYLDSSNIYSNRARLTDLRSEDEGLQLGLGESQTELEADIADLGIVIDSIQGEDGKSDLSKLSKENTKIVEDLESYGNVKAYEVLIDLNNKRKALLTKEYSNLISDKYQKEFKEDLKQKKQKNKQEESNKRAKAKKEVAAKEAAAKAAKSKAKTKTTEVKPTRKLKTDPVEENDGDLFEAEGTDESSTKLTNFVNRTDLKPGTILNSLETQLKTLDPNDTEGIQDFTSAIDFIKNKYNITSSEPDKSKDTVDKGISELADFLEDNSPLVQEDLSPTQEEDDSIIKQKISKVINLMTSLSQRGVTTSNFTEVAEYLQSSMGKDRFVPLFNDIKDIYNLSKVSDIRVEDSYEDIFYSDKDRENAIKNDKIIQNATLPEGFYNYDNESINEFSRQVRLSILGEQGYTVYKSDTLNFSGLRTVTGFNKLAHLDKKYSTNVNVLGTGKFNVLNFIHSRQDISNVLDGSTDEALLDFTQLNVGSRITLIPLNKVVYDDGTIVYGDGRVEKDGEIEQKDPNEVSPIGISLDGVLLDKVFLHTTEWINVENIAEADDVKYQKNKMYEIRKQVLEAGEKGITTVIEERTDGFVLRNADGVEGSVTERLPSVQVGIVKDGKVYVGDKATATVKNGNKLFEGTSVVVLPVNKGVNLAMPINRTDLSEKREYIDSMLNAVELYLKNDVNDERAIQLFDSSSIDITTEEGLREYLSKFIYLPNDLDFEFDSFAAYLENQSESVSLVRIAGKNIEFGRGAGIGKGARFLNRSVLASMDKAKRQSVIGAAMTALDNTLSNNMTINISKNKMNKKFILPLITDTEVNTSEIQYNDFVKDHTKTDLYSHTLSNGKEIYTIQSNIEFNTDFTKDTGNKVSDEATNEVLGLEKPFKQKNDGSGLVSIKTTTTEKEGIKKTKFKTTTANKKGEERKQDSKSYNTIDELIEDLGFEEAYEGEEEIIRNLAAEGGISVVEVRESNGIKAATIIIGGGKTEITLKPNPAVKNTTESIKVSHKGKTIKLDFGEDFSPLLDTTPAPTDIKGIDLVFSDNPALSKIGTEQQYSEYIKTIFPDSVVKDIVYHGGNKGIESFDKNRLGEKTGATSANLGFFFSDNKDLSNSYISYSSYEYIGEYKKYLNSFYTEINKLKDKKDLELSEWNKLYTESNKLITKLLDLIKRMYNSGHITTKAKRDKLYAQLEDTRSKLQKLEYEDHAIYKKGLDQFIREAGLDTFDNMYVKDHIREDKQLYQVILDINNPSSFDKADNPRDDGKFYSGNIQEAIDKGSDSTILTNVVDIGNYPLSHTKKNIKYRSKGVTVNDYYKGTDYVVFNPNQIHILGSQKDIEGFKSYMESNLSPKQLSDQELQDFVDTTPSSLLIQGVPIKTQTALIDYLSAEIIKERTKEPVTDFKGLLEVALEAYQDKLREGLSVETNAKIQKGADVLEAVLNNYNKLTSLVEENLLTYNNLKYTGASFTVVENETETINENKDEDTINELEETEKNRWSSEAIFTEDAKSKASEEVKLALGYVQDVESFNIVNGKRVPVGKTSVFGLESYILFDEIVNEISGILAFNNYDSNDKITQPTLDSMLATLENWVDTKPYLHNVIERINEMPATTQNMLVGVMSKHYTHHTLVYKSAKNNYYVNNSDSNNVAAVVQNSWLQNLINSDLIVPSDTSYVLDEEVLAVINERVANLVTALKAGEDSSVIATDILNSIGIDLNLKTVEGLIKNPIDYGKGAQSLLALFTSSEGAIKIYLDRLESIKGTDVQDNHPFKNNSSLSQFAKEIAKRNPVYFSNSFKDVRGRTYYSYSANKFFIDRIRRLKTDTKLLRDLAAQPFSANSYWVDMMSNRAEDFYKYFKYGYIDGKKSAGDGSKGKKLSQMSPAEHEESKVALFFSQNKVGNDKNYIVNVFYPTTSDKGIQPTLSVLGHKISKNLNPRTQKLTDNGINWLYDMLVEPEVSRMLAYQANPSNHTTKGYSDGAVTFNMFPHLNMVNEAFIIEDGVKYINPAIRTEESIKIKLKAALKSHIESLVADKITTWDQYGFVEETETKDWDASGTEYTIVNRNLKLLQGATDTTKDVNNAAYNYVVNYLVANVNMMQTMITDPANFFKSSRYKNVIQKFVDNGTFETAAGLTRKDVLGYYALDDFYAEHATTFDNMGKRLAGDVAPGTDPAFEQDSTFTLAHINDEESKSASIKYLNTIIKKGDYNGVNSTDAQEYTTLKEHLTIMVAEGKITKAKASELNSLESNGKFINANDLDIILQPMKPVYVNNVFRNGAEHRVYVKSSSFPLLKQLTRGLEIDKLRVAMLRDKVDRVAFGTAIKVGGTVNSADVLDKNTKGKVLDNISLTDATFTLPRAGFKIQQEVPHKEGDNVNDGSQQRKLLTSAVRSITGFTLPNSDKSYTGEEIQNEMDATYNRVFEIKYNELVAEIDYDVTNNTVNLAKIQEVLQKEGLKRSYPLYDLEGFKLDKTGEDFIVPLWMNSSSTKVESMLNSIVDNRIRKFKPKGRSYVLGSSTGFRPTIIEGEEAAEKIRNTAGIILDKEWEARGDGQLLGMRVENGEVKPAEVMLKPRYKDDNGNLISTNSLMKDGYIDLTKLDKSLLEHFAFRIPTQGLNSMAYVKVVGFLPETSGDLFLAPADWTIQMGSDFDVDKIFTNSYNTLYNKDTGAITRYEGDNELKKLEDYLLDLHLSILGNPSKEVQSQILNPLDFGMLGELAEEIYPIVDDSTPGRGMSEEYQKFKYLNARAGAVGIGVFSNDSTFNALAQGKDIRLVEYVKKETIDYIFSLGDRVSNGISNPLTNGNKKRTKADVIAAYQSLAVDNENEQGMHKLNINSYTFDAIRTLAMSGFEEDVISYFINQPIVREFVKLKTLADDNSTSYNTTDLDTALAEKYPKSEKDTNQNLSLETLKEGLKGKRNNHQQNILALFEELTEKGKIIQSVQSAINTDSAGMGKDLFYAYEKEAQIMGLEDKAYLVNADKLIGDYTNLPYLKKDGTPVAIEQSDIDDLLTAGYLAVTPMKVGGTIAANIKFIRPTTINGFTSVRALMFNNRLWERFFPYNNSKLNLAFESIKSITNQTQARLAQNAEINQELFKDAKSYIVASQLATYTDGSLLAERQRLLVDTKENISLGNIVKTITAQGYTNPMLNRLTIQANKQILPTSIQYQASATENINERALYAAFSNMFLDDSTPLGTFNEIEYTPRKLAQDMVTSQLISGGVQQANQYVKYIPMNYLHSVGFYQGIKNVNFYNEGDFNDKIYTNQHIQHNPQKVKLKKMQSFLDAGMVVAKDKSAVTYKPTDRSSIKLPAIFSIKNDGRVKGFDLYFKSENTPGQWERVSTLGYGDIKEYTPNVPNATSIIPDNNSIFAIPTPVLPTDPKDVKEFNKLTDSNRESTGEILNKKEETVVAEYNLRSNETFVNKTSVILDKIIENNFDPFNTLMAKEVLKNVGLLSDFTFILTNTIDAQAAYSMKDKSIKVNLSQLTTDKKFEEIILEELIHALTKPAIVANKTGAVNRLNGLRSLAISAIKKKYGEEAWRDAVQNIEARNPLSNFEYNVVYPLINDVEFVGRLFKSKELQDILNETPSNEDGKSVLEKFWDTIVELLESIGLDIKKGSALEYAMVDIISLVNQQAPSSAIQGEMKKANPVHRTKEWIENNFNLKDENGLNKTHLKAGEIAEFINSNYEDVQAVVVNSKVIIEYKYKDLLGKDFKSNEDLSPSQKTSDNIPLFKSYQDRIRTIEKNIDKAKGRDDFKKVEQLTSALDNLVLKYQEAVKIGAKERLAQIAVKGKQDMQEVAEFFESEMTVEDTLYIRKILHFWETATDTLFDESERESKKLVDLFGEVETSARYYSDKLVKIESNYMEDFMKKYGKATTIENVFNHFRDINYGQEMTMDISRIDNDLLSAVYIAVKEANIDAVDELNSLIGDLSKLETRVVKVLQDKGYKKDELYDLFRQKTKNGKLTGHLVSRYNRDFSKQLGSLARQVEANRDFTSYSNYMNWARNNTKTIKLGYLFPTGKFSKEEQIKVDKYKKDLKAELGTNHYEEFIDVQSKGVVAYNKYKDDFLERLMTDNKITSLSEVLSNPKTSKAFSFWKKANSPYEHYRQLNNKTDQSLKEHKNFGALKYITQLPSDNKSYDESFKAIESDSTLYEFFNYYSEVDRQLKSFMPTNDRVQLAFSGLPHIEKSIFSAYNEKGMKIGLAPIWGEIKKSIRENPESDVMSKNLDSVTGIEDRDHKASMSKNNKKAYDNYVFNNSIEYVSKTGEDPTQAMLDTWREEIVDELAQQKSYNLPKILRVYSMTVLAYKHKSKIEDSIKLSQNILNTQKEIKRNNKGIEVKDESGTRYQYLPVADSFTRTKNQFNYYIDSLYGKTNESQGVDKKKSFTSEEKSTITDLEEKLNTIEEGYKNGNISSLEYDTSKKNIETQIDDIGGFAAWSKRGDVLLKYIQLKGMGWNVMSAIANIGFGTIANVIEGEGGQIYTNSQLNKGYRMTMGSIGRNATFNRWNAGEALKIRNMMNKWDILKDASHELYENPFTVELSKKHKWLSPYNLTQRTEYINQAPLMIAMMLNTPIVLDNGEKTNLWEVTDEEGNIKDGAEVSNVVVKKLRIKIDQIIKRNHGNYDPNSPLAIKQAFIGRALAQFRSWMFEGYAARFEDEKFDPALDITIKGRYRSLFDYFSTDVTPNKIVEVLKGLAKFQSFGTMFKEANFEQFGDPNDFKDVDVANMRRVVAEAVMYIDMYVVYLLLSMFAGGLDDDDDSITKFAINSMINQGLRLRTDLTFYVSPTQFKALLRDPLPAASIIKDAGEWGTSAYRFLNGDDKIGSGVYSGHSRFMRESAQMLPLGTQAYRIFNYGIQTFDK